MQQSLLAPKPRRYHISPECWVEYRPWWYAAPDGAFDLMDNEVLWEQRWFKPDVRMPRQEAIIGEPWVTYRYSGQLYRSSGWHPWVRDLARELSQDYGVRFTAAFCNLYETGQDSIGWHSDDERNLGPSWPSDIVIASLSLGATRRFAMRPKESIPADARKFELHSGDLLVMGGACQRDWEHSVPKTKRPCGPRINLTFRAVVPT